jgi:hypothetical protein
MTHLQKPSGDCPPGAFLYPITGGIYEKNSVGTFVSIAIHQRMPISP